MFTILAIVVGFSLVSLAMLGSDVLRARRLTPIHWTAFAPSAGSGAFPSVRTGTQLPPAATPTALAAAPAATRELCDF